MDPTTAEDPQQDWATGPDLLESVWRYRWLVLAVTVLAGLSGFAASYLQPTMYEAEARLLLEAPGSSGVFGDRQSSAAAGGDRYVRNQAEAANSPQVAARAAQLLDSQLTEQAVGEQVQARPSVDVDVLTVSARAPSPEGAALLANAVAQAYGELSREDVQDTAERAVSELTESRSELEAEVARLEGALAAQPDNPLLQAERESAVRDLVDADRLARQISTDAELRGDGISSFQEAEPPGSPAQPQPVRNAAVAAVLGLLAAAAFSWWRAEHTQSADRRQDAAPVLRAPLLGQIPDFKSAGVTGVDPTRTSPHSSPAEAYQFVVASLEYALERSGGTTVVVTSAGPGDGKTVTALNLAVAAARDGRRVLLTDGDQRARGLTRLTEVASKPGLTDLADDAVPFDGCVAKLDATDSEFTFVPVGTPSHDAAGFYRTPSFRKAMSRIRERADLVIIDTPPVLAVSDTSAIAGQADGIVVVVKRGTALSRLEEVRERLAFVGTPVLGYVFNRADPRSASYSYGDYRYGYGYGYGTPPEGSGSGNGNANGSGRGAKPKKSGSAADV
ncbi:MAG: AAA family ATPase [Egibacteraceae bacterium]